MVLEGVWLTHYGGVQLISQSPKKQNLQIVLTITARPETESFHIDYQVHRLDLGESIFRLLNDTGVSEI